MSNINPWEQAYLRFETPEEEIEKFIGRLNQLGQKEWPRDLKIIEIFCGRGNGLIALKRLGFTNLMGVDLSPALLKSYQGDSALCASDCRWLPLADGSCDMVIVQGGLHHLPVLPDDLELTLAEVKRALRPGGKFVMVEPWLTPFLRVIHFLSEQRIVRRLSKKFDAFATMVHYERETYFSWLGCQKDVNNIINNLFFKEYLNISKGKYIFIGSKSVT